MQEHIKTRLTSRGFDYGDLENGYLVCEYCNQGKVGEIHHISSSFRFKRIDSDPNILLGLCKDCHYRIHNVRTNDFDFREKEYKIVQNILEKEKDLFSNFK